MMMPLLSMKIKPKWFALILLIMLIVPAAAAFFINLYRDPFQIVTADNREEVVFLGGHGASRFQHASVVRHYQPRSVVIGNSLAANFLPTRIEELLSWRQVYSLILPGATIYEQSIVARFALKHADIDEVLWLSSPVELRLGPNVINPKVYFPAYLYDDMWLNDLTVFTTLPSNLAPYVKQKRELRDRLSRVRSSSAKGVDSRDYATAWHFLTDHEFNVPIKVESSIIGKGKGARKAYRNAVRKLDPQYTAKDIQALEINEEDNFYRNFQQNVYSLISDNPETQFEFVLLPPLSRLYWQHLRLTDTARYKLNLAYIREATALLSGLPNVSIYAFGREKLTENLRLYRDKEHYHFVVSDYMLTELSKSREPLTLQNVDDYLSGFDGDVRSYRLPGGWPRLSYKGKKLKRGELTMAQARYLLE